MSDDAVLTYQGFCNEFKKKFGGELDHYACLQAIKQEKANLMGEYVQKYFAGRSFDGLTVTESVIKGFVKKQALVDLDKCLKDKALAKADNIVNGLHQENIIDNQEYLELVNTKIAPLQMSLSGKDATKATKEEAEALGFVSKSDEKRVETLKKKISKKKKIQ